MSVIGHGVEICTYATRPASPALGTVIYQTDTNEYLKFVNYGGANRWMQANPLSGRRLNLNGAFDFWERGTSGTGGYVADRYQGNGTNSFIRSTDTPTGFLYSAQYGNSVSAYPFLAHKIESIEARKTIGKYLTISFWVKNVTGTTEVYADFVYPGALDNWATSTVYNSSLGGGFVPTSSWQYYSFTSTVVTPSNVSNGLGFFIPRNAGTAATTRITGVQLEIGTAPSEFEYCKVSEELSNCQRYYFRQDSVGQGYNWATTGGTYGIREHVHCFPFPTEMRIVPTVSASFVSNDNAVDRGRIISQNSVIQKARCNNTGFSYYNFTLGFGADAEL